MPNQIDKLIGELISFQSDIEYFARGRDHSPSNSKVKESEATMHNYWIEKKTLLENILKQFKALEVSLKAFVGEVKDG